MLGLKTSSPKIMKKKVELPSQVSKYCGVPGAHVQGTWCSKGLGNPDRTSLVPELVDSNGKLWQPLNIVRVGFNSLKIYFN